jgi:hypothetical protein
LQAQQEALNSLGFDWDLYETAWNEQYQKLVKYKQRCGHCRVPHEWKEDPTLAGWVSVQRKRQTLLADARREALDSLGFDWDPYETLWNEQFQKLVEYKQRDLETVGYRRRG